MNDNPKKSLDLIFQADTKVANKGCLFLGSVYDTDNLIISNNQKISAVLTVGEGPECEVKLDPSQFTLLKLSAYDHPNFNIKQLFEAGINFIKDHLLKGNVFVHCFAGVSRSPSVVIAFLMETQKISFQNAFDIVKSRRPIIQPNQGFVNQLKEFEKNIFHENVAKATETEFSQQKQHHN